MKHTIKLKEVRTTTRTATIETDYEHPDLDSLIKLVASGVNNTGFDDVGDEGDTDVYQEINGVDIDFIEV
ncbi:MAG TPA: hypothetical protein EYN67_12380 [Flavobacteriales bacterium]|nr:hypothetical protein [Methylococcaceae bacterium]HHZ96319.1 hypothetical protein [Flavobacteriales bacterium]